MASGRTCPPRGRKPGEGSSAGGRGVRDDPDDCPPSRPHRTRDHRNVHEPAAVDVADPRAAAATTHPVRRPLADNEPASRRSRRASPFRLRQRRWRATDLRSAGQLPGRSRIPELVGVVPPPAYPGGRHYRLPALQTREITSHSRRNTMGTTHTTALRLPGTTTVRLGAVEGIELLAARGGASWI